MNKKILYNSLIIFIIASIFHFIYTIFPSFITSIFFPVNESIFEHLKLLFTASIVSTLLFNINEKEYNIYFIAFIKAIINIILLLIIYLPIRSIFGEVLILTLLTLFISILLTEIIIKKVPINTYYNLNKIGIILIILSYIIFTILSYHPPKTFLFYDTQSNNYGIKK